MIKFREKAGIPTGRHEADEEHERRQKRIYEEEIPRQMSDDEPGRSTVFLVLWHETCVRFTALYGL
jgi:hypothetical protein